MQRRTLLLFALFVVTAWFYSSLAGDSTEVVVKKHQTQLQVLSEVEEAISGKETTSEEDQG